MSWWEDNIKWILKEWRMDPTRLPKFMISWKPEGRNKWGLHRRTRKDGIYTAMSKRDLKKGKDKVLPLQAQMVSRVGGGIALPFLDRGIRRGEWSAARPISTLPPGKNRYPLYRRLGGPQDQSWGAENLVPPVFDPRTVQPLISRYTKEI
jgi:hypothetical protein